MRIVSASVSVSIFAGLRDFWVRDATDALYVCQTELRAWYTDYIFAGYAQI